MRRDKNIKSEQIRKHGQERYDENNKKRDTSRDGFIRRLGKLEGEIRYKKFIELSKNTKENFIKRHGKTKGSLMWKKYTDEIKYRTSEQGWTDKHGTTGIEKRNDFFKKTIFLRCPYSTKSKLMFDHIYMLILHVSLSGCLSAHAFLSGGFGGVLLGFSVCFLNHGYTFLCLCMVFLCFLKNF